MNKINSVKRYAIRKLSVGTVSVAVASLLMLGGGSSISTIVEAATIDVEVTAVVTVPPKSEAPAPTEGTEAVNETTERAVESTDNQVASEVASNDQQPTSKAASNNSVDSEAVVAAPVAPTETPAEQPAQPAAEAPTAAAVENQPAAAEQPVAAQPAAEAAPQVLSATNQLNKIVLPEGYNAALLKDDTKTNAEIDRIASPGLALNNFVTNPADQAVQVDIASPNEAVRKELSIYVASLINPLREQFGVKPLAVNAASVKLSNDVADAYKADNWFPWSNGHDQAATGRVVNPVASAWGENLASLRGEAQPITLDNLKSQFYRSIVSMLFNDAGSNYGHARNFLLFDSANGNPYLGVSTNRTGTTNAQQFGTQFYTIFAPQADAAAYNAGDDYPITLSSAVPGNPTDPVTPPVAPTPTPVPTPTPMPENPVVPPVMPENPATSDATMKQPVAVVQAQGVQAVSSATPGKQLPETGENSAIVVTVTSVFSFLVGLGLMVFKRKES